MLHYFFETPLYLPFLCNSFASENLSLIQTIKYFNNSNIDSISFKGGIKSVKVSQLLFRRNNAVIAIYGHESLIGC